MDTLVSRSELPFGVMLKHEHRGDSAGPRERPTILIGHSSPSVSWPASAAKGEELDQ